MRKCNLGTTVLCLFHQTFLAIITEFFILAKDKILPNDKTKTDKQIGIKNIFK